MNEAVIALAGKQFKIKEGEVFSVDRIEDLNCRVLAYFGDKLIKIGTPEVKGVKVVLEKIADKKDKKVQVNRFKSKSRYYKTRGHRQPITDLLVKSVNLSAPKSVEKED